MLWCFVVGSLAALGLVDILMSWCLNLMVRSFVAFVLLSSCLCVWFCFCCCICVCLHLRLLVYSKTRLCESWRAHGRLSVPVLRDARPASSVAGECEANLLGHLCHQLRQQIHQDSKAPDGEVRGAHDLQTTSFCTVHVQEIVKILELDASFSHVLDDTHASWCLARQQRVVRTLFVALQESK